MTLSYIITFIVGAIIGFAICAIVPFNGYTERLEEAYNKGVEDGKRMSSSN